MNVMSPGSRIHVAGHTGMVGAAIVRKLQSAGFENLILRTHAELDLTDQQAVNQFYADARPDFVFLAAARVGGILANSTYPAEFIRDNLAIQSNVIHAAWKHGARKLLFLGSSCIYPRDCPQPIREEYLLTGPLEQTNEWYAVAKIAGLKMCQAYRRQYGFDAICAMPTNLYGPGDNYHPQNAHVVPALIRRFDEAHRAGASEVVVWGTGTPLREFMHVDDLADALVMLMQNYSAEEPVNIGSDDEVSIAKLAQLIADTTGYKGKIRFDASKPDGTPRKRLDAERLRKLGWSPAIHLAQGLSLAHAWFRDHHGAKHGAN